MPKKLKSKADRKPFRKTTTMVVEEWAPDEGGLEITLQTISARAYEVLQARKVQIRKGGAKMVASDYAAGLCAASIVDENGKSLFTTADLAEDAQLVLGKIVEQINLLNGFDDDEGAKEKNGEPSSETPAAA